DIIELASGGMLKDLVQKVDEEGIYKKGCNYSAYQNMFIDVDFDDNVKYNK
ncbi:MAG: hypothetical protein QG646_38, partial [Euryarchaeota archaeon]|nr:hypothetical protein [Euryarchaeota archaeon]